MFVNPFPKSDADKREIWDMLVRRDIEAFAANDWGLHKSDFLTDGFFAMNARHSFNPDNWKSGFADFGYYGEKWADFAQLSFGRMEPNAIKAAHLAATTLDQIDLTGDFAAAHKKFDGIVAYPDESQDVLNWQTLFFCRKKGGRWWISGFIGFMPNPMGSKRTKAYPPDPIQVPVSQQHVTAGPYSPVLEVRPGGIVVISGQAPVNLDGKVTTLDFNEQTKITMNNCLTQLKAANCDFADVFKVNVYLTDLKNWPAFNKIYRNIMTEPFPVRTAVQTPLLDTFQVEIEMWAVKP